MTFIESVAIEVLNYYSNYGIKVASPIIAQAVLETGNGKSDNAQVKISNNNVLGIKYKDNRVQSYSHLFTDGGWEVEKGEIVGLDVNTLWYGFSSIAQCVVGYFEFIQASWYAQLKNCTNSESYCYALQKCGYATDTEYAEKLIRIIEQYELSKYDEIGGYTMDIIETNLSFTSLTKRTATNKLFIHHAAATTCDAETIHAWHKSNGWSGIGYHFVVRKDGTIERGRPIDMVGAHTSGYNSYSIGICFEGNFETEEMSGAQKLAGVELIEWVKSEYGITNVYRHKDVASTACPGANFPFTEITTLEVSENVEEQEVAEEIVEDGTVYVVTSGDTLSNIADKFGTTVDKLVELNAITDANKIYVGQEIVVTQASETYLVKVTVSGLNIRAGAGTGYAVVGVIKDNGIYTIVETQGNWGRLKSNAGWISVSESYVARQ